MKNNTFTPWFIALIIMLSVSFITACSTVNAQSSEGRAFVTAGDYVIDGFGMVSLPEQGNHFHHIGAEAFFSNTPFNKKNKLFFGGSVRNWSRYNTAVISVAALAKFQRKTSSYELEYSAGPVLQHRGHSALGGMMTFKGTFLACQGDLAMFASGQFEVGNRGIFSDMHVGARFERFALRTGGSSFVNANYAQADYFVSENFSVGIVYAWDRVTNQIVSDAGFSEYHRRALGVSANVTF